MALKRFAITLLTISVIILITGTVFLPIIYTSINDSIVIIGGTASIMYKFIFFHTMNGLPFCITLFGAAFLITALICLIFNKKIPIYCSIKTSVISLIISAALALGLVCVFIFSSIVAFDQISMYPYAFPASILGSIVALLMIAWLTFVYIKARKQSASKMGALIDLLTVLIYLPPIFMAVCCFS